MDTAQAAQVRLGTLVAGRFQLERIIGIGGMGAVYEALHTFTGRKVAVKLLHEEYARMASVSQRFLQEARATIGLEHPSIIEVLDAGQEADGTLYLVFELLSGESFATAIRLPALGFEERLSIFVHLYDALAVAHGRGIVHRDIKPENVFLVQGAAFPGRVKLLDFGIARRVTGKVGDGITQVGAVLGTPTYMSPEVMVGEAIDYSADLWSMGVMMYRAFGNRLPFRAESLQDMLRMILTTGAPDLRVVAPDLPLPLAALIHRALDRDKAKRWQSAAEVAGELRRLAPWAAPAPVVAAPVQRAPERPAVAPPPPEAPAAQEKKEAPRPSWEAALAEIEGETATIKSAGSTPAKPPPAVAKPRSSWLARITRKKD